MINMLTCGRVIVGVTGASGAVYARRLIECLVRADVEVHCVFSAWGKRLFRDELGITTIDAETILGHASKRLVIYQAKAMDSRLASGSFTTDGMIICPCTSHTLGAIASGLGDTLLTRSAAVTLKEGRRLIVVPREMPTSRIDLNNMLRLSEAGAIICPASPGFYMAPTSVDDLVDFVVGKLLDLMKIEHRLDTRWEPEADRSTKATSET